MRGTKTAGQPLILLIAVVSCLGVAGVSSEAAAYTVSADPSKQRPPRIVLKSKAGLQRAVWGSFCVTVPDDGMAVVLCVETLDSPPRRLSVVRPGEWVTLRFRETTSVTGEVSVQRGLCQGKVVRSFAIENPRTVWRVPRRFRSGRQFELSLGAEFAMADGRTGSTEASLGLLVSTTRRRAVIPIRHHESACGLPPTVASLPQ